MRLKNVNSVPTVENGGIRGNVPEKSQEPHCRKCGNDQHLTKFCRVHQKFRDGYEELVKNNPISNIDQSIYSPEFTKEEMDNRIKEMQREKWRQHFLKNVRQGETPKRRTHQRPILEPKRIDQKIDTGYLGKIGQYTKNKIQTTGNPLIIKNNPT